MKSLAINRPSILFVLTLLWISSVTADDIDILAASFQQQASQLGSTQWSVSVTLKHNDTGWDHYADEWRIVDIDGQVFGNRVLLHPHMDEQPFTRSANGILVPDNMAVIFIEAHDKIDGWMEKRLTVNLDAADNGRLEINNK
jgi:hypothetical protein